MKGLKYRIENHRVSNSQGPSLQRATSLVLQPAEGRGFPTTERAPFGRPKPAQPSRPKPILASDLPPSDWATRPNGYVGGTPIAHAHARDERHDGRFEFPANFSRSSPAAADAAYDIWRASGE